MAATHADGPADKAAAAAPSADAAGGAEGTGSLPEASGVPGTQSGTRKAPKGGTALVKDASLAEHEAVTAAAEAGVLASAIAEALAGARCPSARRACFGACGAAMGAVSLWRRPPCCVRTTLCPSCRAGSKPSSQAGSKPGSKAGSVAGSKLGSAAPSLSKQTAEAAESFAVSFDSVAEAKPPPPPAIDASIFNAGAHCAASAGSTGAALAAKLAAAALTLPCAHAFVLAFPAWVQHSSLCRRRQSPQRQQLPKRRRASRRRPRRRQMAPRRRPLCRSLVPKAAPRRRLSGAGRRSEGWPVGVPHALRDGIAMFRRAAAPGWPRLVARVTVASFNYS